MLEFYPHVERVLGIFFVVLKSLVFFRTKRNMCSILEELDNTEIYKK